MITLTRGQREALYKVWCRVRDGENDDAAAQIHESGKFCPSYRQFRRKAEPGWDCIMVPFAGMWLGIERDGYTHS